MQSSAIDDIVRYISITSIIALLLVCLAFSAAVWIRRNKITFRLSSSVLVGLIAIGVLCTAMAAIRYATTAYKGIVEAHDVFAVRSKADAVATVLAAGGSVKQGDPLVRFEIPGLRSRLASLDSRIMTVREQLQSADLQPLQASASIVERKRRLADQLAQSQSILVDLQKSSRENHRALLEAQSQYSEKLGQLDMQIDSNKEVSTIAASQLAITQDALGRAQYLREQGIENVSLSENRLTDRLSRELTLKKATSDIAALERMKADSQAMSASSLAFLSGMQSSLESQIDEQQTTIATLRRDLGDAEHEDEADLARASEARRHNREAMLYDISGIEAEKSALTAATTIEAPFDGTIIYSNSAPGIVSNNSLLVALAPASGFAARIRMGNDDIPFLNETRQFILEFTEKNILTRFVPGTYRSATPAPFETDRSIVAFDLSLPAEIIERLTRSADPIDVRLVWAPPLWEDELFRCSLMLLGGAVLLGGMARFSVLKFRGAASAHAARLLLPLLWCCPPTEAIARHETQIARPSDVAPAATLRLGRGETFLRPIVTKLHARQPVLSQGPTDRL